MANTTQTLQRTTRAVVRETTYRSYVRRVMQRGGHRGVANTTQTLQRTTRAVVRDMNIHKLREKSNAERRT